MKLKCKICGEEFESFPSAKRKFCSRECFGISETGENNPSWNGGFDKIFWDREYYDENKERISARASKYHRDKKAHFDAYRLAYYKKYPERYKAKYITNNAIRSGELVRKPCEKCGIEKTEAHHEDYSKPLDVTWLCTSCHRQLHNNRKELICLA